MQEVIWVAGLGFLSSVLILIFTNVYHSRHEDKLRKQFIEDQKRANARQKFLERCKDAEAYIDFMYDTSLKFTSFVGLATQMKQRNATTQEFMDNSIQSYRKASEKQLYIYYLNDKTLSEKANQLHDLLKEINTKGWEALRNLDNSQYDLGAIVEQLGRLHAKVSSLKVEMIQRLDELANQF